MTQTKSKTFILPPGTYYVGDSCYVLKDEAYQHVINQFIEDGMEDGTYTTPNGQKVYLSRTCYGDGVYEDQDGDCYPVDAGHIGAVPVNSPDVIDHEEYRVDLSGVVEFADHFECTYEDGFIDIGGIVIDTNI